MDLKASLNHVTDQIIFEGPENAIKEVKRFFEDYMTMSTFTIDDNSFSVSLEFYFLLRNSGINEHYVDKNLEYLISNHETIHRRVFENSRKEGDNDNLIEKLIDNGFKRELKKHQEKNLTLMISNPHSANFSVPGAGKTTVALALNNLLDLKHTLVVVPNKPIMDSAWRKDMNECLTNFNYDKTFVIEGGTKQIENTLKQFGERGGFCFVTYSQVSKVIPELKNFMLIHKSHLILDESHHIKGAIAERFNQRSKQGMAVLELAIYAKRRDILTGTPMPQGEYDIASQFEFLYPFCGFSDQIIESAQNPEIVIKGYWTRTTKLDMKDDLPEAHLNEPIGVEMSDMQYLFYEMVIKKYKEIYRKLRRNQMFGDIRSAVKRIQRISVDPYSLAEDLLHNPDDERDDFRNTIRGYEERAILQSVLDEKDLDSENPEISNKMFAAINLAKQIIESNQKVIIWGQFVKTNEKIAKILSSFYGLDWNETVLFGNIPKDQKMSNIDNFNSSSMKLPFLIAHPKTGGEGISLHYNCRSAIYLDRSYDAREYLQSLDRIHRILPPGISKEPPVNYYFLRSLAPVFETIDERISIFLRSKIIRMGNLLNDPGLNELGLDEESGDYLRSDRDNNEADSLLKEVLGIE